MTYFGCVEREVMENRKSRTTATTFQRRKQSQSITHFRTIKRLPLTVNLIRTFSQSRRMHKGQSQLDVEGVASAIATDFFLVEILSTIVSYIPSALKSLGFSCLCLCCNPLSIKERFSGPTFKVDHVRRHYLVPMN